MSGWIASHPPPQAPVLPSACKARLLEVHPELSGEIRTRLPPVWVDIRTRVFHFESEKEYGATPGGKYLEQEAAKAQGYRSSAIRWHEERNQRRQRLFRDE
ncbi:MAG: hypothetical protein V4671_32705 [Armatimonadota bacterium]